MKKLQLTGLAVLAMLFTQVLAPIAEDSVYAEEATKDAKTEEMTTKDDKKSDTAVSDVVYKYTVQPGDSYAKIARKAAQTYGLKYEKDLGKARIIFIETSLTKAAGYPYLMEGEKVEIKESNIKLWVEQSMKLSSQDIVAWSSYIPYIEFNTDHVGEA